MTEAPAQRSRPRRWRRLGLRREVLILVPAAFFLVALLSLFTLLSYRNAVSLLVEERRAEAVALGRRLAGEVGGTTRPEVRLRELGAAARGLAVVSSDGTPLVRIGALTEGPLLGPLGDDPAPAPRAFGPEAGGEGVISAFVPVSSGGRGAVSRAGAAEGPNGWLRVDLGAATLAAQRRNLSLLTWIVLGADGALGVLVVLFLGHMLTPYETLLERARLAGAAPDEEEDEVAFLLETFERALEGLARRPSGTEDEIAVLQRTLGVSLGSGVLLLGRTGAVLALNETGAELLGIPRPEPGTPIERLAERHPELAAPIQLIEQAVASGREVRREECRIGPGDRPPDASGIGAPERTLGLTVHPLRRDDPGDEGPLRGFLVLFVDLTEVQRRREQARLAESLRQIGELAAGVAHELRNSLSTVQGHLRLIERESEPPASADLPEGVQESLSEIRREADHLHRVLEDFLSFARPGSARLEPVDLRLVVERAAADPALGGAGTPRIEVAPGGSGAATISGDPQLLERALRNLLHNAVEAGRETGSGRVEVTVTETPGGVDLTVADRGPGVPPEIRERLFEPFASGRTDGIGLGLALTHRILSLHGAELVLERREGGGTLARVRFPDTPPDRSGD